MASRTKARKASPDAYFLDANILMYAVGAPHPLRDACRSALEHAVSLRVLLVTDSEVLQELLHRYFAIRKPDVAQSIYRATTQLCDDVFPVEEKHTARALELLLKYRKLSARDAIHIATMEGAGVRRLLSTDTDFDGVSQVDRVDPSDF